MAYTWGVNAHGQLGRAGAGEGAPRALPMGLFEGAGVRRADVGHDHSAFVTTLGQVFTCGRGHRHQLGHGDGLASAVCVTHV